MWHAPFALDTGIAEQHCGGIAALILRVHEQEHLDCLRFMPRLEIPDYSTEQAGLSLDLGALSSRTLQSFPSCWPAPTAPWCA